MAAKIFLLTILVVGVSCRSVRSPYRPAVFIEDSDNVLGDDLEDLYSEHEFESVRPVFIAPRVRRQVHGVVNTNPDGTANVMGKLPLAGNDRNILSATAGVAGLKTHDLHTPGNSYGAASAGLALDNINGHGLSLTGKHIPDFGNQLTAAGKVNMFHNDHHDLSANAFATKTMPSNPVIPNFNTYGGGVDYMYNNKVGASLGMSHTPQFQKTDYSAMGNVNLFRNPSSSLDFNAGYTKSVSPFIPKSSWQPSFGMSYSRFF